MYISPKPFIRGRAICREDDVRLPRSARKRHAGDWIKVLSRVDPKAFDGFGFEGKVLRPGEAIPRVELPEPAILLEYAGSAGGREYLWVLWRYDRERREFRDLAQVRATGYEWAVAIRPIAVRELRAEPEHIVPFDYEGARDRVLRFLEMELEGAPVGGDRRLCAMLDDSLLARIA